MRRHSTRHGACCVCSVDDFACTCMRPAVTLSFALAFSRERNCRPAFLDASPFSCFLSLASFNCLVWRWSLCCSVADSSVCSPRFAQVTLQEVLGNRPPRAFRNMEEAERERLFWVLKAQTTAQRGTELLQQQAPPVRFGPNRGQTEQPRQARRARVLSSQERRERLAQEGQSATGNGGGEVSKPLSIQDHVTGLSFVGTTTTRSVQSAFVLAAAMSPAHCIAATHPAAVLSASTVPASVLPASFL